MSITKINRSTEGIIKTPAYAQKTAYWALEAAKKEERGRDMACITVKIFSIFMLEGIMYEVGCSLFDDWIVKDERGQFDRKKSKSKGVLEDYNLIRKTLGLDNSTKEHQKIKERIQKIKIFRDTFAHPKNISYIEEDTIEDEFAPLPEAEWQKEISNLAEIENDYEVLKTSCEELCRICADRIRDEKEENAYHLDTMFSLPESYISSMKVG